MSTTKIRTNRPRLSALLGLALLLTVLLYVPAKAATTTASISQSYTASSNIAYGSLVSLDPAKKGFVVPANIGNGGKLLGVAVPADGSLLEINPGRGVQVITSGVATTLVSNINGTINIGDAIAVSPFNGVGMKADSGSDVIGLAREAFDGKGSTAKQQDAKDKSGKTTRVTVGLISITVSIGAAPSSSYQDANPLQRLGSSLAGHPVSTVRAVISLFIALVALIALITLIYSSIYGSIVSIGRNPLSKRAVFRSLRTVVAMVSAILAISTLTIALLLR